MTHLVQLWCIVQPHVVLPRSSLKVHKHSKRLVFNEFQASGEISKHCKSYKYSHMWYMKYLKSVNNLCKKNNGPHE